MNQTAFDQLGADDKEIVVTFAQPFVDWQGLFSPLYPAATNKDPAVFNDGWKDKMLTTAGPFKTAAIDPTARDFDYFPNHYVNHAAQNEDPPPSF